MKTVFQQQEIMLVTNSTFSRRKLYSNNPWARQSHLSAVEELEEACWNGLLCELMREIIVKPESGKHIYLKQIHRGDLSLQLIWSEFLVAIEQPFSIDPIRFLPVQLFN